MKVAGKLKMKWRSGSNKKSFSQKRTTTTKKFMLKLEGRNEGKKIKMQGMSRSNKKKKNRPKE